MEDMNKEVMVVRIGDLHRNDVIVNVRNEKWLGTVQGVRQRTTRGTVTIEREDGTQYDFDTTLDTLVTVERWVQTEEEKRAARRAYVVKKLRDMIEHAIVNGPASIMQKRLDEMKWEGDLLRYHHIADLMHAQASYALWDRVRSSAERDATREDSPLDADTALLVAVFNWIVEPRKEYPRDPLSRSTAVISNLMDDVERYAVEKVRESFTYYDIAEFAREAVLQVRGDYVESIRD